MTYYTGELISEDQAVERESQYIERDGRYMYMQWSIREASVVSVVMSKLGKLGRM